MGDRSYKPNMEYHFKPMRHELSEMNNLDDLFIKCADNDEVKWALNRVSAYIK